LPNSLANSTGECLSRIHCEYEDTQLDFRADEEMSITMNESSLTTRPSVLADKKSVMSVCSLFDVKLPNLM